MQNWSKLHPDRHISPLSLTKAHSLIQPLLNEGFRLPDKPHVICNVDKNPLRISLNPKLISSSGLGQDLNQGLWRQEDNSIINHYCLPICLPCIFLHLFEVHICVTFKKFGGVLQTLTQETIPNGCFEGLRIETFVLFAFISGFVTKHKNWN